MLFRSNDTATTEIYTLSLHDALPILVDADDLTIEECKLTPEGYLITQSVPPGQPYAPKLFAGLSFNLAELMGEEIKAGDAD